MKRTTCESSILKLFLNVPILIAYHQHFSKNTVGGIETKLRFSFLGKTLALG